MTGHRIAQRFLFLLLGVSLIAPGLARASDMRTFLSASGYGAGVGALAGVTALAFSERPSENLQYVTRGASIGLYVGIGVGLYLISQPEPRVRESQSLGTADNQSSSQWASWILPTENGVAAGFVADF